MQDNTLRRSATGTAAASEGPGAPKPIPVCWSPPRAS